MNFRTTLSLLVLVVAVGIALYFTTGNGDKPKTPEKTEAHKLLDIDSASVTGVSITSADGNKTVLHKKGSDWSLDQPIAAKAKTYEVDSLVRSLVDLQSRGQLDRSKRNSGGLDHPNFVVELTTASKTVKLSFGDSSSVGDSLYVLVNDSAKPEIVGNAIYATLDKPASTYRNMTLVTTPSSDIKQLQITDKGKTIRLEKAGDGWKMTSPSEIPAESSAVTDLLSSLTTLDATEFLDHPPTVATNSMAHPRLTVSFSTQAPSTQPAATQPSEIAGAQSVKFGGYQDITKKNMFVSVNSSDYAVVNATSEKSFEKTPLDLRNKDLVKIDPTLVRGFGVTINRPATTQPTTRPAEMREFVIQRHKIAPPVLGPALPGGGLHAPSTQPSTPATKASGGTSSSSSSSPASCGYSGETAITAGGSVLTAAASAQPAVTTTDASVATTQASANKEPVAPATQPVDEITTAKWIFSSGGTGRAEDGQVEALLNSFHPLRVEKYIEPAKETGNTYTLTLHAIAASASEAPQDYAFTFIETPSRVIGIYNDVQFEVDRGLIEKLTGDFKTVKVTPPATPPPSFGGPGGGSPFGGPQ